MSNHEHQTHKEHIDHLLKAVEYFNNSNNYLVVISVLALGWVVEHPGGVQESLKNAIVLCMGLSAVFGLFTMGLLPLVAETLTGTTESIYDVKGQFRTFVLGGREHSLPLKAVCWPQQVLFLTGILLYAVGHVMK
jgi:hypothetical protein